MQGGRQGRDGFFNFDPFAGFGGFGGQGGHQSLLSGFFGGRDPFDDPFFSRPFGSPFGSMFDSSFFGPSGSPFAGAPPAGFIEHQGPHANKRGPVIEELNSDDEKGEDGGATKPKDNPRKHSRLDKGPYIEVPDDEADVRSSNHIQYRNEFNNRMNDMQPQPQSHCFTFQSSTVSYGGADGAYYTKSMTQRKGSDGVAFEEFKEADSTTGEANHRVSRGLQNKGHTLARKLNSDGRVDTIQKLHNLNEDELPGFEEAWEGSAERHLPGWRHRLEGGTNAGNLGNSSGQTSRGGWALPSTQRLDHHGGTNPHRAGGNDTGHIQHTGKRAADPGSRGKMRA